MKIPGDNIQDAKRQLSKEQRRLARLDNVCEVIAEVVVRNTLLAFASMAIAQVLGSKIESGHIWIATHAVLDALSIGNMIYNQFQISKSR